MAALSSSYDVVSGQESSLAVNIDGSQTTGIKIAAMDLNGADVALEATSGVLKVEQEIDGTRKVEWLSFNSVTDNGDGTVTLGDVTRNLSRTGSVWTSAGTGQSFDKGAKVKLVDFHLLLNKKANVDRNNPWTEHQTVATGKEWRFKNSSQAIYESGDELYLKSSTTAAKSLAQLAAAAGTDEKVKVSIDDTTSGYLSSKLTGGDGIAVAEVNGGGNETYDIDVDLATDPGLEFSSGALRVKASSGITRDSNGISVNTAYLDSQGYIKTASVDNLTYATGNSASKAFNAATTEQLISDSGYTWAITGNTLTSGDIVIVELQGTITYTENATSTASIALKLGSTALATYSLTKGTTYGSNSPVNRSFRVRFAAIVTTGGATGATRTTLEATSAAPNANFTLDMSHSVTGASSINFTGSLTLQVGVSHDTTSTHNAVQLNNCVIYRINPA